MLGHLQQGSEFLLELIARGGPPPGVGVENVWHTHRLVSYFQVKVHTRGPCSACVFPGLKHTRREWGEVALDMGKTERFMPGDIEGREMPPMVGQE